ncbi:MAG TPA: SRPBCC family protein [Polyangia bacterium]|jgi:uncharacterized membrane protein|nr:SRPBCC family protein [Polyangia bacterium]
MYLLDPAAGRRRRARLRDQVIHNLREAECGLHAAAADLQHRATGALVETWNRVTDEADGVTLEARVRARLGRAVSHPHAIQVIVQGHRVLLRGAVLAVEVDRLLDEVRAVRGVEGVEDQLDVYESPGTVPALQGGERPHPARHLLSRRLWPPAVRALVCAAGGALLLRGLGRRGLVGRALALTGGAVMARGVAGTSLWDRDRLIHVQKTVHFDVPIEDVFRIWTRIESFPCFMEHIRMIQPTGDQQLRWIVLGPLNIPVEWQAQITRIVDQKLIEWRTLPGSMMEVQGTVHFEREGTGSRVNILMSYCPPGGLLGHVASRLLGYDLKRAMDDDLIRLKSLLEHGKTSVHGRHVTRDQLFVFSGDAAASSASQRGVEQSEPPRH